MSKNGFNVSPLPAEAMNNIERFGNSSIVGGKLSSGNTKMTPVAHAPPAGNWFDRLEEEMEHWEREVLETKVMITPMKKNLSVERFSGSKPMPDAHQSKLLPSSSPRASAKVYVE
jgi:hypothetical protein